MEYFKSPRNSIKIAFDIFKAENERARALFLTGRAEYYWKYEHFFKLLNENGISIYAMDHRGQGASERMLEDQQKGHVESFDFFVDDADFFFKTIVLKDKPEQMPVFSLSHSMGGAVSLLLGGRNTDLFQKMVFCSPMWGINFGKIPPCLILQISKLMCRLGKDEKYAIGKGDFNFDAPFDNNHLTHSPENFEKQKNFLKENPDFVLGGPTNRWVYESLKAIDTLETVSTTLNAPVLLIQAGLDSVVDNKIQNRIINRIRDSKKIVVENSWHELLYEEKTIYSQAVNQILHFFHI